MTLSAALPALLSLALVGAWVGSGARALAAGPAPRALAAGAVPAGVEALRARIEPYASLASAQRAGYSTLIPECLSHHEATDVQFGKVELIDGDLDALAPEVLVYEPGADGELRLAGAEFVVPFAAVPRTESAPILFGRRFSANEDVGLWTLHVWTHRVNPAGQFAPRDSRVHC